MGGLGVDLLTLFCDQPSLAAARRAADNLSSAGQAAPKLLNITVLTSMSETDLKVSGITQSLAERVNQRAELSKSYGADGIVCSGEEVNALRKQHGPDFLLVTPGIRLPGTDSGDQKRIFSPGRAYAAGSSHIVVGRPVRDAVQPRQVVDRIWDDIYHQDKA